MILSLHLWQVPPSVPCLESCSLRKKGEVTRKKIKDAAIEGYDTAKAKANEAYAYAKDKAGKVRRDLEDLKAVLTEEGNEMKDDVRAKVLDQLDRLERALEKEEIDEQYDA